LIVVQNWVEGSVYFYSQGSFPALY
jgi:hypothetical protein